MRFCLFLIGFGFPFYLAYCQTVVTSAAPITPRYNQLILAAIEKIPDGGAYATTSAAGAKLAASHAAIGDKIIIHPEVARPSYCSGATYIVLLMAISELQNRGELQLAPETLLQLRMRRQADGAGVWGRWNANGPGTARLFYELGAGRSFVDVDRALPGDFMKIFWRDAVGKNERGHSVIFLERKTENGVPGILFWSSNKPGGYGKKWVPESDIARMLFTRLENPKAFGSVANLAPKDRYLSEMLTRDSSFEEALKMSWAR